MSWAMKIALIIISWGIYGEFEKSDDASEKMNYSYDYIRKMHRKALFEIGTAKHTESFE